jgi:predicted amidohydrolase
VGVVAKAVRGSAEAKDVAIARAAILRALIHFTCSSRLYSSTLVNLPSKTL